MRPLDMLFGKVKLLGAVLGFALVAFALRLTLRTFSLVRLRTNFTHTIEAHRELVSDDRKIAIITNVKPGEVCPTTFLPFPGYCISNCPKMATKSRCTHVGVLKAKEDGFRYVIFSDYDAAFGHLSADEVIRRFEETNTKILVSMERSLAPPMVGEMTYNSPTGENLYVNSGGWMGRVEDALEFLDKFTSRLAEVERGNHKIDVADHWASHAFLVDKDISDQGLFQQYVNENIGLLVKPDFNRSLFACTVDLFLWKCNADLEFDRESLEDVDYCYGVYRKMGGVFAVDGLREPGYKWCRENPPRLIELSGLCLSQIMIDDSCKISMHGHPNDPWIGGEGIFPLIVHSNGAAFKMFNYAMENFQSSTLDKCPQSELWVDIRFSGK